MAHLYWTWMLGGNQTGQVGHVLFFPAVFFDEPLFYAEPQPRGEPPGTINAQAVLWVQELGFAYPPLKVGQHTLTVFVDNGFGFSFFYTWRITVKP